SDGTTYMLSMNDTSSPTINTFSLSASSITLGSSVTITWNVTDNDNVSYVRITSGSQIINSTYAANSTTYTPSSVGTETITLTAFDDSGANVTSSLTLTITAVAITTSSGGGAGGGGTVSNTSFEVIADLISIPLQMSGSTQRIIVIENTGGEKIDFVIDLGTLEEYLILSDTSFSLESGESRSILVGIIATSSPGLTVGRISIIGNGVTKYIPFTMEVESEMVLFDVKLDLLPEYKQVKSGGTLKQQITLFRMTSGELVDVFIHYLIKDMQGNLILEESETFAVQDQRSYTKTIDIPSNLKTGSYVTGIEVRYVNSYAVSSATFDIIEKESILTHTQVTALMLIIGILIVIGIITTFILRIKQTYLGKRSRKARK
ncbi:MAG: PKD domain-containing protein, partial [Nanoarchaeota archaeon]|nr:PKD domain-containing protein [Nanoarchaeota archaeon]